MNQIYDILIVGGGINGTGIARDAAGRGLKVLLCEKSDLASATSSASSKLIHGGLRYLEQYEFRLVKEALTEREVLLNQACHLVHPLRFVLPHHKNLRPAWMIRIGLFLYDHLAKRSKRLPGSSQITLNKTNGYGDILKPEFTKGFIYSDCQVDDSRLVISNAMGARDKGADIYTRCECTNIATENGLWKVSLSYADGSTKTVFSKILINAAGPWVENVQTMIKEQAAQSIGKSKLRLVKGSHIVVPRLYAGDHAYILQNNDNRIVFITPHQEDFSMIGTTDVDYQDDPAKVKISAEETDYLLALVNEYLDKSLTKADIVSDWSGVRPLYNDTEGNASTITRDYVFDITGGQDNHPVLLSIFGGKITTYRKLAEHALEKLQAFLPANKPWTQFEALPGSAIKNADIQSYKNELQQQYAWLPNELLNRYVKNYGSLTPKVINGAASIADLGQDFGHGLYEKEIHWLRQEEWAISSDDILWRRTRLGLLFKPEQKQALEEWLKIN